MCTFQDLYAENVKIRSEFTDKFPTLKEKTNSLIFFHVYCYSERHLFFPFSIIPSQIMILRHAINKGQMACSFVYFLH
jgi:hypothetical protein